MHVQVLSSGSAGNAALVRAGEVALLVDAGLELDELERRLDAARVPLFTLDGIALTHGHLDHARSAGLLSRKSGARVYCNTALMSNASLRRARAFCSLSVGGAVDVRARRGSDVLRLESIALPHDADPTLAFRLQHGGQTAVLCTDLGEADPAVARALAGADYLLLEFNHDEAMLAAGPYSPQLKRRIAGSRGHLSNVQAADVLRIAAGPQLRTLVLAHLSKVNNTPEHARAAARAVLEERGLAGVEVLVAEQDRIGPNVRV